MNLRVWAEFFTPAEALQPAVMKLLKDYSVTLCMAFPHGSIGDDYARMFKAYHGEGIDFAVWALLPDDQGYWACERNAAQFHTYVREIYDWADAHNFRIPWLAVDLELPHWQMESLKSAKGIPARAAAAAKIFRENRDKRRFRAASEEFTAMNEFIHTRGGRTLCPISDFIAYDIAAGGDGFQNLCETPVTTVPWDRFSVMIYTSMMTGYSKGLITPADARWHLYATMKQMRQHTGPRAGVSVGVTYTGKLGDEPYYQTPAQLQPDISAAKAAGIQDITIFNLEGILRARDPKSWFEMVLEAEPAVPKRSLKVDAARAVLTAVSRIL